MTAGDPAGLIGALGPKEPSETILETGNTTNITIHKIKTIVTREFVFVK